ncbi:MAG: serine--tRNA ligase, partial [Elusimicrobiales bacterium]|nr:serine--tRNA ligase [Elusimicrobiales bacterium]
MLDIKQIVANPEEVKKRLSLRKPELAAQIDEVLAKYTSYKTVLAKVEELRAKRNEMSKSIGKIKKEQGDEAAKQAMAEVGKLKEEMAAKEAEMEPLKAEIDNLLLSIPNMPNEKIPVGVSDADNPEYIPCSIPLPKFDFKPLDHQAVGEKLGILDFEAAAALSGSRFALFKGDGARLERAIISFMLDLHAKKGYTEVLPPVIVNEDILIGTGQLPKFREDMYELTGEPKQFLISTAEIPLTNLNRIRVVPEAELPIKLTAYSPCFRKESGTYGKDTRGLIRNHQFDKVELVMLSK